MDTTDSQSQRLANSLRQREYYEANKEYYKNKCSNWRKENPEEYKQQVKKEAAKLKARRRDDDEYREAINEKTRAHYHKIKHERRERFMLQASRRRAKELGLDFNLEESDIVIPELCPILGFPLMSNEGAPQYNSPSLDRIDARQGYVKGNVWVISRRANAMKHDASLEELIKFADWVNSNKEMLTEAHSAKKEIN